jgi:hypothetical protein
VLHSQKTLFFIVTAVKTSNLTKLFVVHLSPYHSKRYSLTTDSIVKHPKKKENKTVLWLRGGIVSDIRSVHAGFTVDKLTQEQIFSEYFCFPYQFSSHQMVNLFNLSSETGNMEHVPGDSFPHQPKNPPPPKKGVPVSVFFVESRVHGDNCDFRLRFHVWCNIQHYLRYLYNGILPHLMKDNLKNKELLSIHSELCVTL